MCGAWSALRACLMMMPSGIENVFASSSISEVVNGVAPACEKGPQPSGQACPSAALRKSAATSVPRIHACTSFGVRTFLRVRWWWSKVLPTIIEPRCLSR